MGQPARATAGRPARVLIAGGGVGGLEAAAALAALAPGRARALLLTARDRFVYRPLSVREPLGGARAPEYDIADLAARCGASLVRGVLARVDAPAHRVATRGGQVVDYDALILALGAAPVPALRGALTFADGRDADKLRDELGRLERMGGGSVVFVVPRGAGWVLPLYELALLTREWANERGLMLELTVVTREGQPLGVFGRDAGGEVERLLSERGIALRTASFADEVEAGQVFLELEGPLEADLVVSLPALVGPAVAGVPHDADGFVPVDDYGRVRGLKGVYAVGDMTTRPLKQGGLAAQQADVVVTHLAAALGAPVAARPYRPVLEGALLTGRGARWLHGATTASDCGENSQAARAPERKIFARHLERVLDGAPVMSGSVTTA